MKFFLGTHRPNWLARTTVPLFVSDRTLRTYKTLPVAKATWALDSGGFTELSQHGTWGTGPSPRVYADRVRRYRDEIGGLVWAAPQDWMCEPFITERTGLTVTEHQHRTVENFLHLRAIAPDLPFVPVLQGWTKSDYLACAQMYHDAGVDLAAESTVGIGSVCRREGTNEAAEIIAAVCAAVPGIRLHGFGIKTSGLGKYGSMLASSDSMAWSMAARRQPALPGCSGHTNCANCPRFAFQWRERVLASLARHATYTSVSRRARVSRKVDALSATEHLALAGFRRACADLGLGHTIHAAHVDGLSIRTIAPLVGLSPARVGQIVAAHDDRVPLIDHVRELRQRWGVDNDPATSAAADTILATLTTHRQPPERHRIAAEALA